MGRTQPWACKWHVGCHAELRAPRHPPPLSGETLTLSSDSRGRTSGECGWAPSRAQVGARGRHTFLEGSAPAGGSTPKEAPTWGTSLFPAKREAKREATKAWQAWPGNQTSSRCLVRSLVSLAGCFPHLHASRPCPLRPWVGAISVRGASVRTRRYPQGCLAQGPTPKNRSEKKSPENSSPPCQRKVIRNDGFRACRGL